MTHAPAIAALRQLWRNLNAERKKRSLQPLSYKFLADVTSSADAIPGEAITVSKSTVAAVFSGKYNASTEPAIRRRLAEVITIKLSDLGIMPAPARKPARRTPSVRFYRCSNQGYLEYRQETYYLGRPFAAELCTVTRCRDGKAKGIRVTTTTASRLAYPVNPHNSQLGYQKKGAA